MPSKQFVYNGGNRIRLSNICEGIFTGKAPVYDFENENHIVIGQKNNQKGSITLDSCKYVKESFFNSNPEKYFLKKGDIILNSLGGGSVGRIGYFALDDKKILTDGHPIIIRTNSLNDSRYVFYALYNEQAQLEEMAVGSTNQCFLNTSDIIHFEIPIVALSKQQQIASFLDAKCAEIDALSADIQAEIDTLEEYKKSVITEAVTKGLNPDVEMKDSGIQWIGKMPAHWETIRGKYVLRYLSKPVQSDDGVITCFRDGEVTLRSKRREEGFTMADKEIGYQGIDIGDLVVHGMDGFAGAIGISDSRGKASPVLNVLDTDMDKKYVMYFLRSMAYSDVFLALATGIRVRSCDLRWNKLAELYYPIPPAEEQRAISKYIDDTLEKANAIICSKQEQLATLDEYKKSVIYEYVTGKKEVPNE